jgi:5-formyltetrahydrofolate cyclo-ligase
MTKKEARLYFREKRAALGHHEKDKFQDLILIRFQQLSLPFVDYLHSYLPIHEKAEPDPEPIMRSLQFQNPGLRIAVPRIINNEEMVHVLLTDDSELFRNEFGILEPGEGEVLAADLMDIVIVPLLGFDRQGNRVGYGKGYYDRFLSTCREDVVKIGLSFFGPVDQIEDIGPWDIALNYCITPEKIYEF